MWQCPICKTNVSSEHEVCTVCGTSRPYGINQGHIPNESNDTLSDFLSFPFYPFRAILAGTHWDETVTEVYQKVGSRATIKQVLTLLLVNAIAVLVLLFLLFFSNPYIRLSRHLGQPDFVLAFIFLSMTSFLVQTVAQFLALRLVGGKGNLLSQAYILLLPSSWSIVLLAVSLVIIVITQSSTVGNFFLLVTALLMLVPAFVSLVAVHHIEIYRLWLVIGVIFVVTIPLYLLVGRLFTLFSLAYPMELYDWRTSTILAIMLFANLTIIGYLRQETKLHLEYTDGVPIKQTLNALRHQTRWIITIGFVALLVPLFFFLDKRYATISLDIPPYQVAFLPKYDPSLLFVSTREDEFRAPAQIEIWNVTEQNLIETAPLDLLPARMRPDDSGTQLIFLDRQSTTGSALVLTPPSTSFSRGQYHHLQDFRIFNQFRNEFYQTSSRGGLSIVRGSTGIPISALGSRRFYSATFFGSEPILFAVADNVIYILNLDTNEILDSLRIGGKLRDLAISPDGQNLYVADALWERIIIIPSPVNLTPLIDEDQETGLPTIPEPTPTLYPDCYPSGTLCLRQVEIEVVGQDIIVLSLIAEPLGGTALATSFSFSDEVRIGVTQDVNAESGDDYLGSHTMNFTCEAESGERWQRCISEPLSLINSPGKIAANEKMCFFFESYSSRFWNCDLLP